MLNSYYIFESKKPRNILAGHKDFFSKPENLKLINEIDLKFKGRVFSGKEIYKEFGDVARKIEILSLNKCLKKYKEKE